MNVSVDLIRKVCEGQGLDYLEVWDQAKRSLLFDCSGRAAILDALTTLPDTLSGTVRVIAGKEADRVKGAKTAKVYEWVCEWDQDGGPVGSVGVDGPSWRELLDLKLELQEQRLRAELAPVNGSSMDRLVDMLQQFVQPVGAAPAAAPAPAAVAAPAPVADGDALPAHVLDACRNVALLYRMDPDAFAAYAPLLAAKVNPAPDGKG